MDGYRYELEYTGLMVAAQYNLVDIAETLLANGADPNVEIYGYGERVNALTVAATLGYKDVFTFLLDNGADVNKAFQAAVSEGRAEYIVTYLLAKGADLDEQEKDEDNMPALMTATKLSHEDVLTLLLEKGANMNLWCKEGKIALTYSLSDVMPGSKKTDSYFMALLECGAADGIKDMDEKLILMKIVNYLLDMLYQALGDHDTNIVEKVR